MAIVTGDQAAKLEEKRNFFLALVRKFPGISRKECARIMRVSTFYASKLVPELLEESMIIEAETTCQSTTRGRPVRPLYINPEYEYFAGIDLEASSWRMVIADFCGNPVFTCVKKFHVCKNREEYLVQLETLLIEAIEETGSKWEKVKAIGLGAPGFLDLDSGIIESYEILPKFKKIPLLDLYKLISRKAVFIQNNIYNLATYDLLKRAEAESLSTIHVAWRSGISAAFSLNGTVYRGSSSLAGEAGLTLLPDHKILQDASGLIVLRQKLPNLPVEFWSGSSTVIKRELRKKQTRKVLCEALRHIALALVNIAAFIDPDELIIYSTIFSEPNVLWEMLTEEFDSCRKKQKLVRNVIRRSDESEFTPAIGAAIFAIENTYKVC